MPMPPAITLRPAGEDDAPFLYRVYAGTRTEELARVPWSEAEKEGFLRMQFEAQDRYYKEQFAGAEFSIIVEDGEPIGRLYVDRRLDEIRIVDIALLPEHRGRGIGGPLVEALLQEAAASGRAVRIHVERQNPALRLYRRLGFVQIDDQGVYVLMEWSLPAPPAS